MITNNHDWLRQDIQTGQWFRVLIRGGGDFTHQVEIPLTPEIFTAELWNKVSDIFIIRTDARQTSNHCKSRWTHHFPDKIYNRIAKEIGKGKTDFLLNGNIYPLIDWNKFAFCSDQGCLLKNCRRDFTWCFEQIFERDNNVVITKTNEQPFISFNSIHHDPNTLMIGGVSSTLPKSPLLIYGYYHTTTGYVCFDLNYTSEGRDKTIQFSQRLGPKWEMGLIDCIEKMKVNQDITEGIEVIIKNMVRMANKNLTVFSMDKL